MPKQLPFELVTYITKFIDDRPTLFSCLYASRVLHAATEPLLYHAIRLVQRDEYDLEKCLIAVSERVSTCNGRLAPYVEEVVVTAKSTHAFGGAGSLPRPLYPLIGRVLSKLTNLKHLWIGFAYTYFDDSDIFKDMPFSLKSFRYDHLPLRTSAFIDFLNTQITIQKLFIPEGIHSISLLPTSLPTLRVVETDHRLLNEIITHRRVTHLKLRRVVHEYIATHTDDSLASLRTFSSYGSLRDIFDLASRMPLLEVLELLTEEPPSELLEYFNQLKDKAPGLRVIILGGPGVYNLYKSIWHVANVCFGHFPNLEYVEFQQSAFGEYGRWYPSSFQRPEIFQRGVDWDWSSGWEDGL